MTVQQLRTADGVDLAAESSLPAGDPTALAVLLHPHPAMGGDMHATVPAHLFDQLPTHGIAALRFDFRGAGRSGGELGGGSEEVADVRAAVSAARRQLGGAGTPTPPLWLVGWSYGADVSLQLDDPEVSGWVAITPTLKAVRTEDMAAAAVERPKLLLVAEHDQFCSPDSVRTGVRDWRDTTVVELSGTDHFLAGALASLSDLVVERLSVNPGAR